MARLVLCHSSDPESLLLDAAAPLLVWGRPAEPLPLLVLRQGTLRDEVIERAARAGCVGWLGSPVVLFAELPRLLAGETAPLHPRERQVLLGQLARERRLTSLQRLLAMGGLARAVDSLLGDLLAERVEPEAFEAALATLPQSDWAAQRDRELVELYRAYPAAVEALPSCAGLSRSDGRDGLARAAETVRERPDEVRRRLRRPFRPADEPRSLAICGLSDLRRGWRLLLDALHAADVIDELCVYLPTSDGLDEREALSDGELWEFLGRRADEERGVAGSAPATGLQRLHEALFRFRSEPLGRLAEVRAFAAPDPEREAAEVARRVKRLILEEGAEPGRIAVVSRQSRPYAPLAAEALRAAGVPASARLRTQLDEVPAVCALLGVFRAAAEGWTTRALLHLAESPYFDLELDAGPIRRIASTARLETLAEWEAAHERLAAQARTEDEDGRSGGPTPERARQALASFRAFRTVAERFTAVRPLSAWLELALESVGGDQEDEAVWPDGLWRILANADHLPGTESDPSAVEAVRLDRAGLDALPELFRSWLAALRLDPAADTRRTPAEWCLELTAALGEAEVVLRTPHQRGVQVTEAFAAVGRPWDHLFVVGMSTGAFPAEPGTRPLFDEQEQSALRGAGLPLDTGDVWFAREAGLFRSLLATARRSLHLSHAYADANGRARLPSAYFDEVRERIVGEEDEQSEPWVEVCPGSRLVPETLDEVWSSAELRLFTARAWRQPEQRAVSRAVFALLRADPVQADRVRTIREHAALERRRQRSRSRSAATRAEYAHPWNGRITDPALLAHLRQRYADSVWSVSRLETYGHCPWSFFAQHVLRLEPVAEVEDDLDAATRGSLLHLCLERLHRQLMEEFGDDALDPAHLGRAEQLLAELVPEVVAEYAHDGWAGAEELRGPREQELLRTLRRYVRWEMQQNDGGHHTRPPRRAPAHFELSFGMDGVPPVTLQRDGRELRLRGKIDRVDVLTDSRAPGWKYVVDHKSGKSSLDPVGKYEEGAILQLPLYLQVVRQLEEDGPGVWGGAYQVISSCSRPGALHPRSLTKKGISEGSKTQQESAERIEAALDHALDHVETITGGHFPARIPDCSLKKGCPSYCNWGDICREDRGAETGA